MDKRDELLKKHNEYESYLIELIDSIQELSDESFEERVKCEDEIIFLKKEIEEQEPINNADIEAWADKVALVPDEDNSHSERVDAYQWELLVEGAKAMRDNEIKHIEKFMKGNVYLKGDISELPEKLKYVVDGKLVDSLKQEPAKGAEIEEIKKGIIKEFFDCWGKEPFSMRESKLLSLALQAMEQYHNEGRSKITLADIEAWATKTLDDITGEPQELVLFDHAIKLVKMFAKAVLNGEIKHIE